MWLKKNDKYVRNWENGRDENAAIKRLSTLTVYRDNISVKRSTPTVRFAHKGINPFNEINKVIVFNM